MMIYRFYRRTGWTETPIKAIWFLEASHSRWDAKSKDTGIIIDLISKLTSDSVIIFSSRDWVATPRPPPCDDDVDVVRPRTITRT